MTRRVKQIAMYAGVVGLLGAGTAFWVSVVSPLLLGPRYQATFDSIRADDGIDQQEAGAMASLYFWTYVGASGAPDEPKLIDGVWIAPLRIGVAGESSGGVLRIDPRSGAVSSSSGRTFGSYGSFRRSVAWRLSWRNP